MVPARFVSDCCYHFIWSWRSHVCSRRGVRSVGDLASNLVLSASLLDCSSCWADGLLLCRGLPVTWHGKPWS